MPLCIIAAGAAALLAACDEVPTTTRHSPAEPLAGTWRWVRSMNVATQQVHTPGSEGFEAVLLFAPESEREGAFAYLRNDGTRVDGTFGIGSEDAPGNDFIVLDPSIDFLQRNAWVAVGPDTLYLNGAMEGGYDSRYVRAE